MIKYHFTSYSRTYAVVDKKYKQIIGFNDIVDKNFAAANMWDIEARISWPQETHSLVREKDI